MEPLDIQQLLESLESARRLSCLVSKGSAYSPSTGPLSQADKARLLSASQALVSTLENPQKTVVEIAKGPAGHAALRTALALKLFEDWRDDEIKSARQLAEETGAEEELIARIMRATVGIGIFEEPAEKSYAHTAVSRTLIDSTFRTLITGMSSTASLTMSKLPEYLASLNYHNPQDPANSLFHFALKTKMNMFQWLQTQPDQLEMFSAYNAAATRIQEPSLKATISALFSKTETTTELKQDRKVESEPVLFVDIGAGRGQALNAVRRDRLDLTGRMIAQDLPEVINGRVEADGVENMAYNFLEPQPIKGASIYFFSHILHDWPDSTCRLILSNTVPALTPGQSRIVIVDQILPQTSVPTFSALMDLTMMTFAGKERTERQWRELLEVVGLTVVSVKGPGLGSLSLDGSVEAILEG